MLLKLDEQIRLALDCEQQAKPAAESGVSIALSKRRWLTLTGSLEFTPRLEDFTLSRFCQSRMRSVRKGWKPWIQAVRGGEQICLQNNLEFNLTRRTFIKTAGTTGVTVYVLLSSPAWVGPRIALAANLTALNDTQAKEMLAMARQLFPHDKLGDEYYWVVVESIDKDMAGSPELATRIRDGLAAVEPSRRGRFHRRRRGQASRGDEEVGGHSLFLRHAQQDAVLFLQQQDRMAEVRLRGLFLGERRLHQPRIQ